MHVLHLDTILLQFHILLLLLHWVQQFYTLLLHQVVESLLRFRYGLLFIDLVLSSTPDNPRFSLKIVITNPNHNFYLVLYFL